MAVCLSASHSNPSVYTSVHDPKVAVGILKHTPSSPSSHHNFSTQTPAVTPIARFTAHVCGAGVLDMFQCLALIRLPCSHFSLTRPFHCVSTARSHLPWVHPQASPLLEYKIIHAVGRKVRRMKTECFYYCKPNQDAARYHKKRQNNHSWYRLWAWHALARFVSTTLINAVDFSCFLGEQTETPGWVTWY